MRIPTKLKIGGHTYRVVLKQNPVADGVACPAYIDDENMEIVIDSDLSQSSKESSLFHEVLHGINCVLDHTVLDSLAEQLYQVLSDNKLLND